MRVPLSWLTEYVDLPGDATPDSVMAELVKVGFEEEERLAQVLRGQVEHGDGVALCTAAEFVGCPEFGFA